MSKKILAIDPGFTGAFVLKTGDEVTVWPMPVTIIGKDKEIDFLKVKRIIREADADQIFMEWALPFAMGTKQAFSYGRAYETLRIAVRLSCKPFTLVHPNVWTKEMHVGINKDMKPKPKSLIAIKRLFPKIAKALPKDKKGNLLDGPIDAVLIAGYAERLLNGKLK